MTEYGYALLGLTAAVAVLVAVLTFAVLKFTAGARDARRRLREGGAAEAALLSTAMQEAVARLQSQEQAVRARAAASERLSIRIVESLSAGLLVVEESGRIEIFNRAARRMLEIDGDTAGGDYRDVLKDVPPLGGVITECLATRRPIVRRSLSMMVGGKRCHFGVTVSSLRETEEQGAICLFSDITNVVELEEQLRLKDTLARLGELTAGIAHEFRNGLATIHGYSRLLDPGALPAAYRPYVEGIRQETDALGQIVTNFLNFARPENISFHSVAVGRIAQRAADDLRRELPEGTTTEVEGDFGDMQGDEVLLRQMFANLVRNAAEACDASGKRPQIVIRGAVDRSRGLCRLTVDDNGPGIAESDRDRVFQPFFTTRSRGTGLGLSVVQKIVVTHNGRVSVGRSTMGGASIEILFPVA
jgi:two-component system, NtrC family, nitrogen regulation sensor histidine kinase GlnL